MKTYGWKNLWTKIEIKCPWCSANQTVYLVNNECFYCKKDFFVCVNGTVLKSTDINK